VLSPASEAAEYRRVELWIDKETFLTRQIEVEEANGVIRRFTLGNQRPDLGLPSSLFRFSPPPGVEVFEQ
jgi:outer membrane lipoprotein-sorting protein